MNHWWVNQNQTYEHEVKGGYLWSPKATSNGRRNRFYDSMTETVPGDIVFSYCDTYIKAIGVVSGTCQAAPRPTEFGSAGEYWSHEGWYVPVTFTEIKRPIRPKDLMTRIGPTLPQKYSPIQLNGNGNQAAYLAPVPPAMAGILRELLAGQVEAVEQAAVIDVTDTSEEEVSRLLADTSLTDTERQQLINARRGQGLFRSRVELIDPTCRVTGISDRRFLRASHIKPWSKSSNVEKLDGNNGLMLAPHIDHLFDKGYITFANDGRLLKSPKLPAEVAKALHVDVLVPRAFSLDQVAYLEFHRELVYQKTLQLPLE